jgi:hypothetical protein
MEKINEIVIENINKEEKTKIQKRRCVHCYRVLI